MNIYTKLTVLCLFLVITSSVALIFFSNRQFSKQFQEEIASGLQERTTIAAQQVINFLEERASEISFAANQNELNTAELSQLIELGCIKMN